MLKKYWKSFNMPIYLYLITYFILSLLGILFLIFDNQEYLAMYEYMCGVARPVIDSPHKRYILIGLSILCPLLLSMFFFFANKFISKLSKLEELLKKIPLEKRVNNLVIYFLTFLAYMYVIYSFNNIVGLHNLIYAFTNYNTHISARFLLFNATTSPFFWVVFYSFIPVFSGYLYLQEENKKRKFLIGSLLFLISLLTLQKNTLYYLYFSIPFKFLKERKIICFKNIF
ncbi:hypothetical protein [Candidatus Paracaedibacter symbiosus]|uniref:hypothetical protein n=1 Tax=Candidatus Paracaedibacter symbiosus TaxID=244582 RepID=UPI00050959C1|nr:hypothetical protein [Candidatus Paracaedibacter symbiosus]